MTKLNETRSMKTNKKVQNLDSKTLTNVLKHNNVCLGGASFGKGLTLAAQQVLQGQLPTEADDQSDMEYLMSLPGASALNPAEENTSAIPPEDSFYVMDIGVVISQVYQWRKYLPRVEMFYAVKCNPNPVIVEVLAAMGCNFDCASRQEIRLVQSACSKPTIARMERTPEIIYANPCKAPAHLREAVCRGVRLVTFDNIMEVQKCASISSKIQLVLRIITDDRGSQCRFSTKFGAPEPKWKPLLAAAKQHGLEVVGVSFHVGSGCRDSSKYQLALQDARKVFDMGKEEFGFDMSILDIGGGFPGETHSIWNPSETVDVMKEADRSDEGKKVHDDDEEDDSSDENHHLSDKPSRFMCFTEIAQAVAPMIDELFEPEVRVIAEPGRYLVAACATLCCSVVAKRDNVLDNSLSTLHVDSSAAQALDALSRTEENQLTAQDGKVNKVLSAIHEELSGYHQLYTNQQLTQQEFDVYNDGLDLYREGLATARDLLGPPEEDQINTVHHTVEGMSAQLVDAAMHNSDDATVATTETDSSVDGTDEEFGRNSSDHSSLQVNSSTSANFVSMSAAGEAAVNGMVLQAVVDSSPAQDDYAYYINDGVYGAFNNLMFDHATVRPRVLKAPSSSRSSQEMLRKRPDSLFELTSAIPDETDDCHSDREMFASTVFGPTCDSIDVISRSVLLPKLDVGDYLYFTNMGAYTMAAASSFNGFDPSQTHYVCSIQPEFFEHLV